MIEVADQKERGNVMDLMDGLKQSLGKKAGTTTKHAGKKRDDSHLRRERKSA
jgi:hypothetical protein